MSVLRPDNRGLYVDALKPPPGMVFDRGIATTYSLDLETLLALPLHLVLCAGEGEQEELLRDGVVLLDALRQTTRRLRIYCNRGRILLPRGHRVLFSLLEPILRQVDLRADVSWGGSFHPKVWLLRYVSPKGEVPPAYRLLVLSRNLTHDVSWDVSLQLEGPLRDRPLRNNLPLVRFLASLAELAPDPATAGEGDGLLTPEILDEVSRVVWQAPDPFSSAEFIHIHPGGRAWRPKKSKRLLAVSPFLTERALNALAESTDEAVALVSRVEGLEAIPPATLRRFGRTLTLHEAAATEDGEDTEAESPVGVGPGLHAKLFLTEEDRRARLYLGSTNATGPAMDAETNVEFMVQLTWRRPPESLIDSFLGPDGMGEMLADFAVPDSTTDTDPESKGATELATAWATLRSAELHLVCEAAGDGDWHLRVQGPEVALPEGVTLRIWPVTVHPDQGSDGTPLRHGEAVTLGPLAPQSLTTLIAFEIGLPEGHPDANRVEPERFVLSLPEIGLPHELRDAALTRQIVAQGDGFLRYLLLLLGDLDPETGSSSILGNIQFGKGGAGPADFEDLPIVEEMARAFSRNPERLDEVARLVERLTGHADGDGDADTEQVIPEQFRQVWEVFQQARELEG